MFKLYSRLSGVAAAALLLVSSSNAYAQERTFTFMGNSWAAIAVVVGLVVLLGLVIWGVLGISSRDKSDDDEAGVGVLEGIDEDDDRPKKKKR